MTDDPFDDGVTLRLRAWFNVVVAPVAYIAEPDPAADPAAEPEWTCPYCGSSTCGWQCPPELYENDDGSSDGAPAE